MSLYIALNNALTSLNVNKKALETLSQNIANANSPTYSRKIVEQSAIYIEGTGGAGVRIDDISRKVDVLLQNSIQQQKSFSGMATVVSDYADQMQILLGKPGAANSLDTFTNTFFNAVQSSAESPENTGLQLNVVNSGTQLASYIGNLATQLHQVRYQADQDIKQTVDKINQDLKALQTTNLAIFNASTLGQSTSELFDRRDMLVQDIAQYADVNAFYNETGAVSLTANGGITLIDNGQRYELTYTAQGSLSSFINDSSMSGITSTLTDSTGALIGVPQTLVSDGKGTGVTTALQSGRLKGLLELRDLSIPAMIDQLDMMASTLRDQFNSLHNTGSNYPGAQSLTGTRSVNSAEQSVWAGKIRIAVLNSQGQAAPSPFEGEPNGLLPLTLDLSMLDSGVGAGQPSVQTILNEINSYYGLPQNKVSLGNLNNIRLASNSTRVPDSNGRFNFDFDLENISGGTADFFVKNIVVTDDTNTDISSFTTTMPRTDLASTGTFVTTAGSTTVTVNTAAAHGLSAGDRVYLSLPGAAVDGIPAAEFNQYFVVSNVTATSYDIVVQTEATAGGSQDVASQTATGVYKESAAGTVERTTANGTFTADFAANPSSSFYTVTADVAVEQPDGSFSTARISYKLFNPSVNTLNQRTSASAVAGSAVLKASATGVPLVTAKLVDAQGVELPKINGAYTTEENGFLQIVSNNTAYKIALDPLDSQQKGLPNQATPVAGSNRNFAHYFELNNFFASNIPTNTGDTVKGSAVNMRVEQRLISNPALLSTGKLVLGAQPSDPNKPPNFSYQRLIGDNSLLQQLAQLGNQSVQFDGAGGITSISTTFNGYASTLLSFSANNASNATGNAQNQAILLDGFVARSTAQSGVNLDEELGNTIIYQSAFSASARLIQTVNGLFDDLLAILR